MSKSKREPRTRKAFSGEKQDARALVRDALRRQLHAAMRGLVYDLFEQEVTALCGPRYKRDRQTEGARAGGEQGSIYWDGRREPVRRPRVRDKHGEVHLESYDALRDYDVTDHPKLGH